MSYSRRPDFDLPTAEEAERSRRTMLWLAPAIMLQQASRLMDSGQSLGSQIFDVATWMVLTLAILWVLAGWPVRWLSERDQLFLNDEGQQAMRAQSMRWGLIATSLIGCALMIAQIWVAIDSKTAINALVSGGIVVAALRLAWLNREDPADDE